MEVVISVRFAAENQINIKSNKLRGLVPRLDGGEKGYRGSPPVTLGIEVMDQPSINN